MNQILFQVDEERRIGETCQNLKNRMALKLTTDSEKAMCCSRKLHVKNSKCIGGLHMLEMFKQEIIYDKTIKCGRHRIGSEQTSHYGMPLQCDPY